MQRPNLSPQVDALLQNLADTLQRILGEELIGVYLHGSLGQGTFNPDRSDIDVMVVTRTDLEEDRFQEIGRWLAGRSNPWFERLEMRFLIQGQLLEINAKACLYQDGEWRRSGSDGNPIIWLDILDKGVVIFGQDPSFIVPEIRAEQLFEALIRELGYLREALAAGRAGDDPGEPSKEQIEYRIYSVVTVCRILFTFENGTVATKLEALGWALSRLDEPWRRLALQVERSMKAKARPEPMMTVQDVRAFVDFAEDLLRSRPFDTKSGKILPITPGSRKRCLRCQSSP